MSRPATSTRRGGERARKTARAPRPTNPWSATFRYEKEWRTFITLNKTIQYQRTGI